MLRVSHENIEVLDMVSDLVDDINTILFDLGEEEFEVRVYVDSDCRLMPLWCAVGEEE